MTCPVLRHPVTSSTQNDTINSLARSGSYAVQHAGAVYASTVSMPRLRGLGSESRLPVGFYVEIDSPHFDALLESVPPHLAPDWAGDELGIWYLELTTDPSVPVHLVYERGRPAYWAVFPV